MNMESPSESDAIESAEEEEEEEEEGEEEGEGERGGEEREKYPCGSCALEVRDDDEAIYCESGCEQWYHRECTGMSKVAYDLLTAEDSAEWVCDLCVSEKAIPMIKMVDKS